MGEGGAKKKRPWRFCPEDWKPTEKHWLLAAKLRVDMATEEEAFRDHEFAKPKTDPDRAFSQWLRNSKKFGGNGRQDASTRLRNSTERTADYLRSQGIAS